MSPMTAAEEYRARQWFVAGYMAAIDDHLEQVVDAPVEKAVEVTHPRAALRRSDEAVQAHGSACLACGREGVVILDGCFCERCAPGGGEAVGGDYGWGESDAE